MSSIDTITKLKTCLRNRHIDLKTPCMNADCLINQWYEQTVHDAQIQQKQSDTRHYYNQLALPPSERTRQEHRIPDIQTTLEGKLAECIRQVEITIRFGECGHLDCMLDQWMKKIVDDNKDKEARLQQPLSIRSEKDVVDGQPEEPEYDSDTDAMANWREELSM